MSDNPRYQLEMLTDRVAKLEAAAASQPRLIAVNSWGMRVPPPVGTMIYEDLGSWTDYHQERLDCNAKAIYLGHGMALTIPRK